MVTESFNKVAKLFSCSYCDYITCKKSSFDKHLLTVKHIKNQKGDIGDTKVAKSFFLMCSACGKEYNSRNGLWKHKKTCNCQEPVTTNTIQLDMSYNLILEIVKQNQEFKELLIEQNKENQKLQQQILEIAKEGKTINNTTNNTNNNFNLQFFLNEQCKDALNIMDFINQLQLKTSDLDMLDD